MPNVFVTRSGSFPWLLPAYLSSRGFDRITALDIGRPDVFPPAPDWRFRAITSNVESEPMPFETDSVDVCVLYEVFEHLYQRPNFVFREIKRVLRPGGRLLLSTPNGASLSALFKLVRKRQLGPRIYETSEVYERLGHFAHLREYSVQEIRDYLANFEFVVRDVRYRVFGPVEWRPELLLEHLLKRPIPPLRDNIFMVMENAKSPSPQP